MRIFCFFTVCVLFIFIDKIYSQDSKQGQQPKDQTPFLGCRRLEKAPDDKEFRVAWLAPEKEFYGVSANSSVGAVKLALAYIVQHEILSGYTLRAKWYDSKCDSKQAMSAFMEAVETFDPDVILGPACSRAIDCVAQLGSICNLPVFSWVSDPLTSKDQDKYTTLVSLSGPLRGIVNTLRQVSMFFEWHNYALIYDKQDPYESVADALMEAAVDKNYTIKSTHYISSETTDGHILSMLHQIKKFARVIIFVVPWHSLRHYLLLAHQLGMANGEYAFLCVHNDLFVWDVMDKEVLSDWGWRRGDDNDEKAREIYESVIHIIPEPFEKHTYERFRNFTTRSAAVNLPEWELPFNGTDMNAYAPYLYDAIITWAQSVNYTLGHGGNTRDGASIKQVVPEAVNLTGVTGDIVFNLPTMERLSNYRVLDMRANGTFYTLFQFHFRKDNKMEIKFDDKESFKTRGRWPTNNGEPPLDTPVCGFEAGEKCKERVQNTTPVSGRTFSREEFWGMFGAMMFVILVQFGLAVMCTRRNNRKSVNF